LGVIDNTLKCETRCFAFCNLTAICYPPKKSLHSDISISYNVAARSSVHKISLFIGSTPTSDKKVAYNAISEDSDLRCYVHLSDQVTTDLHCCYLVLQRSQLNIYTLDIGYSQGVILRCVTKCELNNDLKCCVFTHMKITTRSCFMHRAVNPDNISEVKSICYRIAGATAQVQPFQVIGGYRHINDLSCILKLPTPSISTVLCCNHGSIDSAAAYTTMRSGDRLLLNVYNIGSREILNAEIKQKGLSLPAQSIKFSSNLWVVAFDVSNNILNKDYFITLRLKGLDKMLILSAIKGKLNI